MYISLYISIVCWGPVLSALVADGEAPLEVVPEAEDVPDLVIIIITTTASIIVFVMLSVLFGLFVCVCNA